MRSPAVTLLEVLIAIAIFGLFLTAATTLYVSGYHAYKSGTEKTFYFRKSAVAFDAMTRELHQCEKIYSPAGTLLTKSALLNGYYPTSGENAPFVFVKYDPAGGLDQVLAYTLEKRTSTIVRMLYAPQFDPGDPSSWIVQSKLPKAGSVRGFGVRVETPPEAKPNTQLLILSIIIAHPAGEFQLESKVRIQGGL